METKPSGRVCEVASRSRTAIPDGSDPSGYLRIYNDPALVEEMFLQLCRDRGQHIVIGRAAFPC